MSLAIPRIALLLCSLGACSSGTDSVDGEGASTDGSAHDAGSAECTDGASRSCNCGNVTQLCAEGSWVPCDCSGVPPTPTPIPMCKAGYYTGDFTGEYWSGVFDIGFGSLVRVNINAKPVNGKPGLGMTLRQGVESGGAGNPPIYTVKDGCLIGTAEAVGTEHPIFGIITGELDCQTGLFQGTLRGYYYLFGIPQVTYKFEGPVSATYKPEQQRLADGAWDVKEHQNSPNAPGGHGTWDVSWSGGVEAAPALPPECEDLLPAPE